MRFCNCIDSGFFVLNIKLAAKDYGNGFKLWLHHVWL